MNREKAIDLLDNLIGMIEDNQESDYDTALKMAIQALSQEPCTDTVSKKAVLNAIEREDKWLLAAKGHNGLTEIAFSGLKARVDALPSVTHNSGKWIEHLEIETSAPKYLMFYECSECGDKPCFCKSDIHKKRFCSNCGAKMVEPQESEDN